MNKIMLIGRLTKDCELKYTAGEGKAVAMLTLAVDKFVNGQKQADYIGVVIWGKQAESTATYTVKGSLIAIAGRIQTRSYDAKDGSKRYITEVVANEVQFLSKGNAAEKPPVDEKTEDEYIGEVDTGDIPF